MCSREAFLCETNKRSVYNILPQASVIGQTVGSPSAPPVPQYYRVAAVAQRLSVSSKTILRRLKGDPDVRIITERKRGVRRYQTVLIPESSIHRLLGGLCPQS